MRLHELTIVQAHQSLIKKEFSAAELCEAHLKRIEELDEKIRAFLNVTSKLALRQARAVDEQIKTGRKISMLAGIPICIKDNILIEGVKCTAGSKILENYIAPYNATVIKKLREAGVIMLGKTNMDEFAMGASTENSGFFPTRNPHDLTRVPGGSSGGSAAAVAAKMSLCALGSDTAGSIRQPASFCGIVGFKPSYGAVSRHGLIAMACSLDQIGTMARNVEDARILFEAIKGKDPLDSTSVEVQPLSRSAAQPLSELKIGIPKEYFIEGIDKEVEAAIKKVIKKFEQVGAKILEISLPHVEYSVPAYYVITPSEISANLARYDGIKFGYSVVKSRINRNDKQTSADSLIDVYLQSRGQGLGDEVRRRIMLGTYALSVGYYDAYYLRAQKVRHLIIRDFEKAFKKVDVILTPTMPAPAFKIGEKINDPVSMYLCDVFTGPVNMAGLPAVSLPCGNTKKSLPVGFQIIGKRFEDEKILQVGRLFEKL
jgi:aspartyl-tRNA(Asn)/glutamyl-tRNA(Gln) amidotransferase subunit A